MNFATLAALNRQGLAGAWVAPGAGIALLEFKGAKTVEGHAFAVLQGALDLIQSGVQHQFYARFLTPARLATASISSFLVVMVIFLKKCYQGLMVLR